jgi:hypothetical protein
VLTDVGLRAMSSLSAVRSPNILRLQQGEGRGPADTRSLTALTELNLTYCGHVTAAAKQALRTAISNLTIVD